MKSLPWLILTNCEHKVITKGLALDQLEPKIQEVTNANQ